jgi:hypothetical protein
MTHPTHFFIVKCFADDETPWAALPGDLASLSECRDAVLFYYQDRDDKPETDTVLVMEIDGGAALDRTEDMLSQIVVTPSTVERLVDGEWRLVRRFSCWRAEMMPAHMHRAA